MVSISERGPIEPQALAQSRDRVAANYFYTVCKAPSWGFFISVIRFCYGGLTMEEAPWDLLRNAAMAIVSEPSDQIIVAAYFILAIRGLIAQPLVIHVILCNVFWFVSAIYPAYVYWLLCAISASYVTIFYYDNGLRAWIGSAVLTFLLAIMGMENVLAWIGWQFIFDALYDRYEVCVISIHILIVCLLIDWRKLLRYLGEFSRNLRNGQSRANMLFSLV